MSDNKNDLVTIYNCFNKEIGTEHKKVVHQKGLWHRAVSFILLDTTSREIIFQHSEAPSEIKWDGFFVKMNGGHIQHGEEPIEGFRELEEELGLKDRAESSHYAGTYQLSVQFSDDFINNEFVYFYIVPGDDIKKDVQFDEHEVKSIISVNVDDALALLLGDKKEIDATVSGSDDELHVTFSKDNFRNFTDDNLYLRIMIAAKRYLDDEEKRLILI